MLKAGPAAAALSAAWALAGAAAAQDAGLRLYAVPGLYGLEQSNCHPGQGRETARIAPALCPLLDGPVRVQLGAWFRDQVKAAFPAVVTDLSAQRQAGETAEAALSRTAIVSLQLTRADIWLVEKPQTYEVQVPISLSLYVTNALTGEVLFVDHASTVVVGQLTKANYLEQVRAQFPGQLQTALQGLVYEAAGRFRPYAVNGKVRGKVGDLYVVDAGRRQGVREGDLLGPGVKVVWSEPDYSVARALLGGLQVGQTLSHQAGQPVEALEKPSALVVVADADGGSTGYVEGVFADAVGADAGLNIMPVNPAFVELRQKALGDAQLSSAAADRRALPDYFVRVSVRTLPPYETSTSIAGTRRRVYQAIALVEVVDPAGRVVYATRGVNQIEDAVAAGITFSPEQRQDTVVKNALTEAAHALSKGFRPTTQRFQVKGGGSEVEIADPAGAIGLGARLPVLRRAGRVAGVTSEVWVPVTDVQVTAVRAGGVTARLAGASDVRPRGGDEVALQTAGGVAPSPHLFSQCLDPTGAPMADRRGSVDQPLFGPIAANAFAGGFKGPIQIAGFAGELRPSLSQFEGVDTLAAINPRPADICFLPVYQVEPQGGASAKRGQTVAAYDITMGFVLRQGQARVGGTGLQQTLKTTGLPPDADEAARSGALQHDLAGVAAGLTTKIAASLPPPT